MPVPNVLKILDDLKYKSVGVDPETKKMPEGFFVSFRPIGLAIPESDFRNPWTPTGGNLKEILSSTPKPGAPPIRIPGTNPAAATPPSASAMVDKITKDQYITAGVGESMQAYLNTFMLTDDKLEMNSEYRTMPKSGKINDAWFAIINGANGIPSNMELDDEMKKALEDAKAVMMDKDFVPTPKYEAYERYSEEYRDAVKSRDRQYANSLSDPMMMQMWPIQGKTYQDDIDEAWDKWQSFGFKAEIDKAIATLSSQGIDPAILLISRSKRKYENSLINIPNVGNIPYTFMLPRKWYSASEGGWNKYSETAFHSETHTNYSSSNSNGYGGISLGFVSIGGYGTASEQHTNLDIETTNLSITFEYTVVDIKRPWLDTTLLNLSNWFLVGDYPASCISDGTYGQELKTHLSDMLFMPSIITSLILVRNVNIQFDESIIHRDTFAQATSGGGALSLGPLFLGGTHSGKNGNTNYSIDQNSRGICIDGVQLIGYVSTIMPASPKKASKEFMQEKEEPQPPVT
jgi:hypothetical protein